MATTISLLNMKGGVGKTTLAVNLAWYMHQNEDANVLLVDLDPQFNATQYVMDFQSFQAHRKKAGTISDLIIDPPKLDLRQKKVKANPRAALHNIEQNNGKRFDLLPAELSLAWVVKNPAQMDYRLEKVLSKISGDYDFIFIDCAPTDSVLTTMALTASDYLLIPMRPDRFSILGFANLSETIKTFRSNCPDTHMVKILGVVFTQVTNASQVETDAMIEIAAAAQKEKVYLFQSLLKFSQSYIRSVKDQTPIFQTLYAQDRSKFAVGKISNEIKTRIAALPKTASSAKGKNK
ncbi:MAG TPA: ParA family protein [Candidatus Sulfotelmatobacter sp.]|nr:ParA family protein [Candidatus Sulfotelmatobacter sp.]